MMMVLGVVRTGGEDRLLLTPRGDQADLQRQALDATAALATLPLPLDSVGGGCCRRRWPACPRWLLLPAWVLRRPLGLPAAAADRLREVVGFEIDRRAPVLPPRRFIT